MYRSCINCTALATTVPLICARVCVCVLLKFTNASANSLSEEGFKPGLVLTWPSFGPNSCQVSWLQAGLGWRGEKRRRGPRPAPTTRGGQGEERRNGGKGGVDGFVSRAFHTLGSHAFHTLVSYAFHKLVAHVRFTHSFRTRFTRSFHTLVSHAFHTRFTRSFHTR